MNFDKSVYVVPKVVMSADEITNELEILLGVLKNTEETKNARKIMTAIRSCIHKYEVMLDYIEEKQ